VSGQLHAPAALPPDKVLGTHRIRGWVDPRVGMDVVEKREFLTLMGHEFRTLGRPARSQSLHRLPIPGPHPLTVSGRYTIRWRESAPSLAQM
jgi:hypothetical protein